LDGGGKRFGGFIDAQFKTQGWLPSCDCGVPETKGAIVLDPFGGSGTTAAEAISMGRRAILCELNPDYVKVMKQRMDQTCPLLVGDSGG
jgi:16S rRNA G966 N2-methylase RsmD